MLRKSKLFVAGLMMSLVLTFAAATAFGATIWTQCSAYCGPNVWNAAGSYYQYWLSAIDNDVSYGWHSNLWVQNFYGQNLWDFHIRASAYATGGNYGYYDWKIYWQNLVSGTSGETLPGTFGGTYGTVTQAAEAQGWNIGNWVSATIGGESDLSTALMTKYEWCSQSLEQILEALGPYL